MSDDEPTFWKSPSMKKLHCLPLISAGHWASMLEWILQKCKQIQSGTNKTTRNHSSWGPSNQAVYSCLWAGRMNHCNHHFILVTHISAFLPKYPKSSKDCLLAETWRSWQETLTNLQRDVDILSTSPIHQRFSLMYQIAVLPSDEIQVLKPLIIEEPRM